MRINRKGAAFFIILAGLISPLTVSQAFATTTADYNQQVAAQQQRVNDLTNQVAQAKQVLAQLQNDSNGQAAQLNDAQTAVTQAQDALDIAQAAYATHQTDYDKQFVAVQAAESKVADQVVAVSDAADTVDATFTNYEAKQHATDVAQLAAESALTAYNNSQVVSGGSQVAGLQADVYNGINAQGNPPQRSDSVYTKCATVTVSNIQAQWGGGSVLGCNNDFVMIHYHGYITYPTTKQVYFYAQADDGFFMSIAGQPIINDWALKGCGGNSAGLFSFQAGVSYPIDAWFYEWGGGACSTLYYQPVGSGQWDVAPASFFSQTVAALIGKDPALKVVSDAKEAAYVAAVAAEEQALQVYNSAGDAYDAATLAYSQAVDLLNAEQGLLAGLDQTLALAETSWQAASDDKAVKDAALQALKTRFSALWDSINNQAGVVDGLETQLVQAKAALAAIPKPSAPQKVSKKPTNKPVAPSKVTPRGKFVPNPKQ